MTDEGIKEIIGRYIGKEDMLIHLLQELQQKLGFLPGDVLVAVSKTIGISLARVYSVASFYKQFYFKPRGKNIVRVCTGTACHIKGAMKALKRFQEQLGIRDSETTEDLLFTLETVSCVGCCALAPVVVANGEVIRAGEQRHLIKRLKRR
ncbi:MAG: NAD(P)H-dependent oxidoreductase subunit E [Gammaproteobacteria bacterium]|nr:NAD(P)H-dependent oxidoreductase subunit E [Gammaproteobacteria bacterium]